MSNKILDNGVIRDATPDEEMEISSRAPYVPQEVVRRKGLQALFMAGITEAMVEAKIEEMLTGVAKDLALIEFRESQTFQRNRPLVNAIGPALGLDLDAIFIQADSLP